MPKHTPKPWDNIGPIIHREGKHIAVVVCDERHPDGDRGSPEQRANAVLLKAAPELLESLKDLEIILSGKPYDRDEQKRLQQARAAIARAEGTAP